MREANNEISADVIIWTLDLMTNIYKRTREIYKLCSSFKVEENIRQSITNLICGLSIATHLM